MPKIFRWIDFLTFGLAALLATVAAVWVQLTPQEGSAYFVTWATAAGFWLVYAMLLLGRLRLKQSVWFQTRHGLLILRTNQRPLPLRMEIEEVTSQVIAAWSHVYRAHRVRELVHGLFVQWEPFPFAHRAKPGFKFTGLASGNTILVGYRYPLRDTAFAHELGHVLYGARFGLHTEEQFQAFCAAYELPY